MSFWLYMGVTSAALLLISTYLRIAFLTEVSHLVFAYVLTFISLAMLFLSLYLM